jgi:PhzF family phenazine biosynthesis protein
VEILRYSAFTMPRNASAETAGGGNPSSGNPAGVVLDANELDAAAMQRIAAEVGYSETAFLFPSTGAVPGSVMPVRYFSPVAEVPFCGHATIALAVAHGDRFGTGRLELGTANGVVTVTTADSDHGLQATLVSVPTAIAEIAPAAVDALLVTLRLDASSLDRALPIRAAFAGAWHPIVALSHRTDLAALDYDYDALAALMAQHTWTTIHVIVRERSNLFHARNPFPPGGVVEDPATGAAAAAQGGYLRALGLIAVPGGFTVLQGGEIGRPSRIEVTVPAQGGISVTGLAARIQ